MTTYILTVNGRERKRSTDMHEIDVAVCELPVNKEQAIRISEGSGYDTPEGWAVVEKWNPVELEAFESTFSNEDITLGRAFGL